MAYDLPAFREKRRAAQEKEQGERLELKRQRRDLEKLSQIQVDVENEIVQQELRQQRRKVRTHFNTCIQFNFVVHL